MPSWRACLAVSCLLLAGAAPIRPDQLRTGWTFSDTRSLDSWSVSPGLSGLAAEKDYWSAVALSNDLWLSTPDRLGLEPEGGDYLAVRMRITPEAGTGPFGAAHAAVFWITDSDDKVGEDKGVHFKVIGNGEWRTHLVFVGDHPRWKGGIRRITLVPCDRANVRIDIQSIQILSDDTAPEFTVGDPGYVHSGAATPDMSPTVRVRSARDAASGLARAELYVRKTGSDEGIPWMLASVKPALEGAFGLQCPSLSPGAWDLGVRVYDRAGNASDWLGHPNRMIQKLQIDAAAPVRIEVDASESVGSVPASFRGGNLLWSSWDGLFDPAAMSFPSPTEQAISALKLDTLRYPGGCWADSFYWKRSIGPYNRRLEQYRNACTPSLISGGPSVFGLDEFLRYCGARGIEPMLTCRFRWPDTPGIASLDRDDAYAQALEDAVDLVEYCNAPYPGSNPNGGTDWALVRALNGHPEPYGVRFFEVGNEPWGGDPFGRAKADLIDAATTYAYAARQYAAAMSSVDPQVVVSIAAPTMPSSGDDPNGMAWASRVFDAVGSSVHVVHSHLYLPGPSTETDPGRLYSETMAVPFALRETLDAYRNVFDESSERGGAPARLRVSEWNINYGWEDAVQEQADDHSRTHSLMAAVASADAIRIFLENADIIEGVSWWHLLGTSPWSLYDRSAAPAYWVAQMFGSRFGTELVSSSVSGSPVSDFTPAVSGALPARTDMPSLSAVASRDSSGNGYLIVINRHREDALRATVAVNGVAPAHAPYMGTEVWELAGVGSGANWEASQATVRKNNRGVLSEFEHTFPACSVTAFRFAPVAAMEVSVGRAKAMQDGFPVILRNLDVSASFVPDMLYGQQAFGYSGMRVETRDWWAAEGNRLTIEGILATDANGERYVRPTAVTNAGGRYTVRPTQMGLRSLLAARPETSGLLVNITGRVAQIGQGYFTVTDDSMPGDRVHVISAVAPALGRLIRVTGIRTTQTSLSGGMPVAAVRTRSPGDVELLD